MEHSREPICDPSHLETHLYCVPALYPPGHQTRPPDPMDAQRQGVDVGPGAYAHRFSLEL